MSDLDQHKLAAARLWAATRFPYLATALFATRILPVDQPGVVAVDEAWRVFVDPRLVQAWRAAQVGSLLVHHIGHLLRDHAGRARALGLDRQHADRWVLAADAEINDDLAGCGLDFPIEPVLPHDLGCEPHRFAEEYLSRALAAGRCRPNDCGSGCDGQPRAWDQPGGIPQPQRALLRCQVASEVLRCCRGLQPGTVPAGLRRWAEGLLNARVDWRAVLAAEIRRGLAAVAGMVDYSYRKPSRRSTAGADVILPGFVRPVPELAVVIDTSGSMDDGLLGQALAEVEGLMRTAAGPRRRLRVIPCDASAYRAQRITAARQVELLGGGGTNMGAGIAAAAALKPRPSVVVVLTDGYTPWPPDPPLGLTVVVALLARSGRWAPPAWARVVQVEMEAA